MYDTAGSARTGDGHAARVTRTARAARTHHGMGPEIGGALGLAGRARQGCRPGDALPTAIAPRASPLPALPRPRPSPPASRLPPLRRPPVPAAAMSHTGSSYRGNPRGGRGSSSIPSFTPQGSSIPVSGAGGSAHSEVGSATAVSESRKRQNKRDEVSSTRQTASSSAHSLPTGAAQEARQ